MVAYEFYWLDPKGACEVIGVLPERRKQPERLTKESVMRWGEKFFSNHLNLKDIFFIQVTIDDRTGRISRPTPPSIPPNEISK
ncbi:MAG TPA: hypothetical protein VLZ10_20525 [Thermodesulfobacteriota bacterium]|nr:hypothetical protein [Thermodesulfobacteriota bacterium]